MPTYQYTCTECTHDFEQFQSFSDDALTHCPECNGRVRKVFNAVGVVFKGSGFYRTDSRGSSSASEAGSSSTSSTSGSSSTSDSGASSTPAPAKESSTTPAAKPASTSTSSSSSSTSA